MKTIARISASRLPGDLHPAAGLDRAEVAPTEKASSVSNRTMSQLAPSTVGVASTTAPPSAASIRAITTTRALGQGGTSMRAGCGTSYRPYWSAGGTFDDADRGIGGPAGAHPGQDSGCAANI